MVVINTNDHIIANGNIFNNCVEYDHAFLVIKNSPEIEVHSLVIHNSTFHASAGQHPLLEIKTEEKGSCLLEKLSFYNNYLASGAIHIDSSVGNLTIQHCDFQHEIMNADSHYLSIGNPFVMLLQNITFYEVHDIHDLTSNALLVDIHSIDLDTPGDIILDGLISNASPISLLDFEGFSGNKQSGKSLLFNNITVMNAIFDTRNDVIVFGPYSTELNIEMKVSNLTFSNLYFTKLANILHLKQQAPSVFVIEHSLFTDINGGQIMIEAMTINNASEIARVNFTDIIAHGNEFKFSTFIVQKQHTDISIYGCKFYQNSAKFRGTALSQIENDAYAHIFDCVFNRNNALYGGVFSIDGNSHIDVHNCTFTSNFALISSIAYILNQGNIDFESTLFLRSSAISVGILEVRFQGFTFRFLTQSQQVLLKMLPLH